MTDELDTATETGRDEADDDTATEQDEADDVQTREFAPSDAWIDTLLKQLTDELVDSLRNYARVRAFWVACAGRKVDDYYARALVQDAIGDTWMGVLTWDPARCDLKLHLMRAIQGRSDKDHKHAANHRHDAIGDFSPRSHKAEREASSMVADDQHATKRVYSSELMSNLRNAFADDRQVLRILDAYDAGAQTKEDVLGHTKMKGRTYHNAHIRLRRFVRNLTDRNFAPNRRA